MERIILEVDSVVAKAWRNFSASQRALYEKVLSALLQGDKEKQFRSILDEAGKIAVSNGLDEEKLNQLLHEEE